MQEDGKCGSAEDAQEVSEHSGKQGSKGASAVVLRVDTPWLSLWRESLGDPAGTGSC